VKDYGEMFSMENIKLIKPTIDLKDEYLDMIKDYKDNNEKSIVDFKRLG